ncbi:chloride channel protein [Phormidesmis priestleyi]|uniref:chloride channel protein n=1 Tax=Phormidesmis priestleyi TaxID=268141 RepID=UPI00093537FB|nr:chloride channel protein [Phormidesmis priestleyi]
MRPKPQLPGSNQYSKRVFARLSALTERNPLTLSRWLLCWVAIGVGSGLLAGIYWHVLEYLTQFLSTFQGLSLVAVMTIAGFLIGLVIQFLGDPGELSFIVDNIHSRGGRIETRENPAMILASLIGISAGGSLGPEAPMVQITGSLGTWVADRLHLTGDSLRTLSLAGMAGGFTALFGSPLGGAFFALEILQHQHVVEYYEAILPAVVSSCASYVVFVVITHLGISPTWNFPQYQIDHVDDYLLAIVFGLTGAITAWIFIYIFRGCAWVSEQVSMPIYIRTTLAGLILGGLALLFPLTRYFGHEQLNEIVMTQMSVGGLLTLAIAKMLAVSVTVQGEWRGGFIIPLFFTGACVGKALSSFVPGAHPVLAMITTMAALNAAITRTPISTTLLLTKLTGFAPFTPILFASLVGYFLSPKIPFIKAQLKREATNNPTIQN